MNQQTMLVIAAYPSDPLVYCGGTILKYVEEGHAVHLMLLSDGLEQCSVFSAEELAADREGCRERRRQEFQSLYETMGVNSIQFCGYDDFPLVMGNDRCEQMAVYIRALRPDFIVTHAREKDLDCLDYTAAALAIVKSYAIASAAGAPCGGLDVSPRQTPMFGMEPFRPENCGWEPGIMIDITRYEAEKEKLMEGLTTEQLPIHLVQQRARARGVHSSGRGGKTGCKYAEAFSCYGPVYAHQYFVW